MAGSTALGVVIWVVCVSVLLLSSEEVDSGVISNIGDGKLEAKWTTLWLDTLLEQTMLAKQTSPLVLERLNDASIKKIWKSTIQYSTFIVVELDF